MKQEVGAIPVSSTLSSEDEADSPEYTQVGHPDEEDGPIDLRKRPSEKPKRADTPPPERRSDDVTTTSADAILDIWQRTLLSAVQPYLSPLLIATAEAAAKAASARYVTGSNVDALLPQAPIVCDPYGGRHLVVRSQDGNVVAVPLGGAPHLYESAKELQPNIPIRPLPLRKQTYSEQLIDEQMYRKAPVAHRGKSELVSRLESAPVLSRSEYHHSSQFQERGTYSPVYQDGSLREALGHHLRHHSDHTGEDTPSHGSSEEEHAGRESPRRWSAQTNSHLFRSRSCSEIPNASGRSPTDQEQSEDRLSPASRSCPSLTVPSTSGRWHQEPADNPRKRKNQYHSPTEDDDSVDLMEEDEEEEEQARREIMNAPITRLFNPKQGPGGKHKMPRLIRMDTFRESFMEKSSPALKGNGYYDPYEDCHIKSATGGMTPEQEETFLERLRHSAPLGVPWNVYSYYNQMMQNLTDPHVKSGHLRQQLQAAPGRPETPQRTGFASSDGSPSPATTPVPVSPPIMSNSAAPAAGQSLSVAQLNSNDARKASRVLTGKHVRQGTGASPSTLMTLRQKIQERQKAKEMSFQSGFSDAKNTRDVKKRNGVHTGTLNKGR